MTLRTRSHSRGHERSVTSTLVGAVRRHPFASYLIAALVVSYTISVPLVLSAQGFITFEVPGWLHYLYSLGPIAAAFLVTATIGGRSGIVDLIGRMGRWRVGLRWTLVAVASPFALFALAALAMRVGEGTWPDLSRLGEVNYLGNIGLWVVPLWIVTYGYGEETGWRGFALPYLQARHSALVSSALVAVAWMVWHIPAFFYLPTYRNLDPAIVPFFFVGVLLGSILLTWIYNGTGGSIFAVSMWHAFWDLVSASRGSEGTPAALMTMVITLWAIAIVVIARPPTLSGRAKQILTPA